MDSQPHKNISYLTIICLLGILLNSACKLAPGDIEAPDWNPEFIGPIADLQIGVTDLEQLTKFAFDEFISVTDLGLLLTDEPSEKMINLGPYPIEMYEGLARMEIGETTIHYSIESRMPVDILAGTELRFVNEAGGTITVLTIDKPIDAYATITGTFNVTDITVTRDMELYIENLQLGLPTALLDPSMGFNISGNLEIQDFGETAIENNQHLSITDTTNFNWGRDFEKFEITGTLEMSVENTFPIGSEITFDLLDESHNLIFSLTDSAISVDYPELSPNGIVLGSTGQEISIPIPAETAERIAQAKHLSYAINLFTPSSPAEVIADATSEISIVIISDFNIKLK